MTTIKDLDALNFAIDSFIRSNSNFESSIIINAATEEVEQCTSMQLAFAVPLQHKLLTLDSALKWVFFLTIIIPSIISSLAPEEGEEDDEETKEMNAKLTEFDTFLSTDALKLIASVYDLGVQEHVLCHIDDGSDSESSSSESGSDVEDSESVDE